MSLAFAAVLASAGCAGTATVLQARAARAVPTAGSLDATLLLRMLRRRSYVVALVLLASGMVLAVLALRTLPLFLVQAGRASSLGVTALLSVLILRVRLTVAEVVAIVAVAAGLVALALSAGPQQAVAVGLPLRFGLLAGVAVIAGVAVLAARRPPGLGSGLALGLLAGLCFALLALSARILHGFALGDLLLDPAAYALALAGLLGLLLSATALQRASVVTVTAAMVATETIAAAGLGLVVCGDRPAPGATVWAAAGFVVSLAGALGLARFGSPAEEAVVEHEAHAVSSQP